MEKKDGDLINNPTWITSDAPILPATTLTATGCTGTITWSNGATGNSVVVSPTIATTYTAICSEGTCVSVQSNAITLSPSVIPNGNTSPIEAAKTARVAVSQSEPSITFKVFPNPATDEINVETNVDEETTFQLYNVIGQKVVEKTFERQTKVKVSEFSRGTYFYLLQHGINRSSGKVILE